MPRKENLYCPLAMAMAVCSQESYAVGMVVCRKDDCAWWVVGHNQCAVLALAYNLGEIQYSGVTMKQE